MQVSVNKLGWLPVLLPAVFAVSLPGTPVQAQAARDMGHKLVRAKILHDAGDRYDIKFITSDTQHSGKRWTRVSGRGSFRRRGKSTQIFNYHVLVNPRTNESSDVGYRIR